MSAIFAVPSLLIVGFVAYGVYGNVKEYWQFLVLLAIVGCICYFMSGLARSESENSSKSIEDKFNLPRGPR
tara:strand:+ start:1107 stop:1319 length:213 start_codon:yes stop_codon:yes gene_type:complete